MPSDKGKELIGIYDKLQTFFDARLKAYTEGAAPAFYTEDSLLTKAKIADLVKTTQEMFAQVIANKDKGEIVRTYETANFLLAMNRDHVNATKTRLDRCAEHATYMKKALVAGDGNLTLDGFLLANIKKVNI